MCVRFCDSFLCSSVMLVSERVRMRRSRLDCRRRRRRRRRAAIDRSEGARGETPPHQATRSHLESCCRRCCSWCLRARIRSGQRARAGSGSHPKAGFALSLSLPSSNGPWSPSSPAAGTCPWCALGWVSFRRLSLERVRGGPLLAQGEQERAPWRKTSKNVRTRA